MMIWICQFGRFVFVKKATPEGITESSIISCYRDEQFNNIKDWGGRPRMGGYSRRTCVNRFEKEGRRGHYFAVQKCRCIRSWIETSDFR